MEMLFELVFVAMGTFSGVSALAFMFFTYDMWRNPKEYEQKRKKYLERKRLIQELES